MQDAPLTIGRIVRHGTGLHAASEVVTWMGTEARRESFGAAGRKAAQLAAEHGLTPLRVEALTALGSVELIDHASSPALREACELALDAGMLAQALATDLLRSTDLGVAAVARRVGYESEEAFSRAFKRRTGESPSPWRTPHT